MTKKLKSGTPFVYDENDRVVGIRDPHTGTDTDLVTAGPGVGGGQTRLPRESAGRRAWRSCANGAVWLRHGQSGWCRRSPVVHRPALASGRVDPTVAFGSTRLPASGPEIREAAASNAAGGAGVAVDGAGHRGRYR